MEGPPEEFRPDAERFFEKDVDMKGTDFRLLPFGSVTNEKFPRNFPLSLSANLLGMDQLANVACLSYEFLFCIYTT